MNNDRQKKKGFPSSTGTKRNANQNVTTSTKHTLKVSTPRRGKKLFAYRCQMLCIWFSTGLTFVVTPLMSSKQHSNHLIRINDELSHRSMQNGNRYMKRIMIAFVGFYWLTDHLRFAKLKKNISCQAQTIVLSFYCILSYCAAYLCCMVYRLQCILPITMSSVDSQTSFLLCQSSLHAKIIF